MDVMELGGRAFRAGMIVGRFSADIGKEIVADSLSRILKLPHEETFVHELETHQIDHEVKQATATYELGRKRKEPELGFIGAGWLLRVMCRADKDPGVPDYKVREIAEYVLEEGLDPQLEPVLSDEEAKKASGLLRKHDVTEVFFGNEK